MAENDVVYYCYEVDGLTSQNTDRLKKRLGRIPGVARVELDNRDLKIGFSGKILSERCEEVAAEAGLTLCSKQ
ncbi:MAG TPA: hypothetical protein VKS21_11780 [Spirochaetota bacterium]|nr:hypothetical protein [Spirochaetota bacterium]